MPYKSDAQRKKFHVLKKQGKISATTVHEFDEASKGMDLPEHAPSRPDNPVRRSRKRRKEQ
jgi:hypothetical protein